MCGNCITIIQKYFVFHLNIDVVNFSSGLLR